MIIKKYIETYMDIEEPNDIYSANRNDTIMQKLTDKFVGICYNSCYILKINKIIRRSYIYMKDTLHGDALSSITFEVDAIIYIKNEIINGCTIVKKEPNGIIHAKSQYGGIQLNITRNLDIFKEMDVVPVIVRKVGYNINQLEITILASPFIPIKKKLIYYKPTTALNDIQIENIVKIIKQILDINKYLLNLSVNDKNIVKFFINLLNMKYNIDNLGKSTTINMLDIKSLTSINSGILVRVNSYNDHKIMHINSDINSQIKSISGSINSVENSKKKITNEESLVIEETMFNIYSVILLQYLSNLQTLKDFLKNYPTFAIVQKNKSIWKLYNMLKK
jgi:hypothetical protein